MNRLQPFERLVYRSDDTTEGERRARHHDHWDLQAAGGFDLGVGRRSARVLADHDVNAFALEKSRLVRDVERTAGGQDSRTGQLHRRVKVVNCADQVFVLRSRAKGRDLEAADGEEDAPWHAAERLRGVVHVGDVDPHISRTLRPWWALESNEWRAADSRRLCGVGGNLRGKGVGRVDQRTKASCAQESNKAIDATKTADSVWNIGRLQARCATGE